MPDPFDPYKAPQASLDAPSPLDPSAKVPASVIELLAQTRPWVRLISILIFVGMGLALLGGVVVSSMSSRAGMPGGMSAAMFIPMFIVAVFYVPPALFLWQYANRIRRLEEGGGMPMLEEAISRQKSFWKYIGIFVAVMLGLYAFFIVMGGLFGAMLSRH